MFEIEIFSDSSRANYPLRPVYVGANHGVNLHITVPASATSVAVTTTVAGVMRTHAATRDDLAGPGWRVHLPSWMFPAVAAGACYDVAATDADGHTYWLGRGIIAILSAASDALPPEAPPVGYIIRDSAGNLYRLGVRTSDLGQSTLTLDPITPEAP